MSRHSTATMSRLALGTAQFGMPYGLAGNPMMAESEMAAILDHAKAHGITMLDTAPVYGEAEARLGRYGMRNRKMEWQVISKLPPIPDSGADLQDIGLWVRTTVRGSLIRLGLPRLHALLLHRPQDLLGRHGAALTEACLLLKTQGLVSHLGVSIEGPELLGDLLPIFPVEIVQAPFNVLDRRLADSGWLARLHTKGIRVHVRSVFLQGLLLLETWPYKFHKWHAVESQWLDLRKSVGAAPATICLDFALGYTDIAHVIIGADSLKHWREAAEAAMNPPLFGGYGHAFTTDTDIITPSRWSTL